MRIRNIIGTSCIVLVIDVMWIIFVALPLYQKYVPISLKIIPAIAAYIFILIGIFQAVSKNMRESAFKGATLGVCMYGVYACTNVAIFEYPFVLAITDILWGAFLCGIGAIIAYKLEH